MALTPELKRKFSDPGQRDGAMMEVARALISETACSTDEMIHVQENLPCLNELLEGEIQEVISRTAIANSMLERIREEVAARLQIMGFPEEEGLILKEMLERSSTAGEVALVLKVAHLLIGLAEIYSEEWNTPNRETHAAIARVAIQSCIHIMSTSQDPRIRRYAKTNLIYFTTIEMLSIGCKTGAYQFGFVAPDAATPQAFIRTDSISPIIRLYPGDDERKFKSALVFGQVGVNGTFSPLPGMEFFFLSDSKGGDQQVSG